MNIKEFFIRYGRNKGIKAGNKLGLTILIHGNNFQGIFRFINLTETEKFLPYPILTRKKEWE